MGRRWSDAEIAEALDTSPSTVHRVRQAWVEWGLEAALARKPPTGRQYRKLDGTQEAQLIAVACSAPRKAERGGPSSYWPTSWSPWTSSTPSVRSVSAPRSKKRAQTVAAQAVGDPAAGQRRVCLCHGGRAGGLHTPLRSPAAAGVPGRDQQTTGGGNPRPSPPPPGSQSASITSTSGKARPICLWSSSRWLGQRRVKVTERRTAVDFAHLIQEVVDEQYPQAEKIVLVMDNLNTHKPASLYEAFAPSRGPAVAGASGDSLHPQAWQLVEYGRDRTQRPGDTMFGPTDSRPGHPDPGRLPPGNDNAMQPNAGSIGGSRRQMPASS